MVYLSRPSHNLSLWFLNADTSAGDAYARFILDTMATAPPHVSSLVVDQRVSDYIAAAKPTHINIFRKFAKHGASSAKSRPPHWHQVSTVAGEGMVVARFFTVDALAYARFSPGSWPGLTFSPGDKIVYDFEVL